MNLKVFYLYFDFDCKIDIQSKLLCFDRFPMTSPFCSLQCYDIYFFVVIWCVNKQIWWFSDTEISNIRLTMRKAWIFKVNTANTQWQSLWFIYCHCKSKPHRKLWAFKVEWHVSWNHWDVWYQNAFSFVHYFKNDFFNDVVYQFLYHKPGAISNRWSLLI